LRKCMREWEETEVGIEGGSRGRLNGMLGSYNAHRSERGDFGVRVASNAYDQKEKGLGKVQFLTQRVHPKNERKT